MDQSLHMAAPLDPERWDEFARPRPRLQPQARPQPRPASDGLAAAQSQVRVGDLLDKAAGGHQALPISAVAALVAQFANLLLTEPQAATSEFNLRSAHVSRDGLVQVPIGAWARSDALLRLLRQALNEAAVPPAVARLLLARPAPGADRIADVLAEFGSDAELGTAVRSYEAGSEQPVAAPLPRPERSPEAGLSPAHETTGPRLALFRDLPKARIPRPSRLLAALVGAALGLVALLAVLSAGASATPTATPSEDGPASADGTRKEGGTPGTDGTPGADVPATTQSQSAAPTPTSSAAGQGGEPVSWAVVLAQLDDKRSEAFATGNQELLGQVSKVGSVAALRDRSLLAQMAELGVKAVGMKATIVAVSVTRRDATSVELAVADELSSYRIVRATSGQEVEVRPARTAKNWRVTLESIGGRWLLVDSVESSKQP